MKATSVEDNHAERQIIEGDFDKYDEELTSYFERLCGSKDTENSDEIKNEECRSPVPYLDNVGLPSVWIIDAFAEHFVGDRFCLNRLA